MSSNDKKKLAIEGEKVDANTEKSQTETVAAPPPPKKAGKSIVLILVILILFGLNGFLFWLIKQQDSATKLGKDDLDQVQMTVESFENTLRANKSALASETGAIKSQLALIEDVQLQMKGTIAELRDSNQLGREDVESAWTIAEVESLLKQANHRLLLASDVKGATTALQLADKLIHGLSDPTFYPLRTLMADEILFLNSTDIPDIEGIASRLQSALNQVDSLQVKSAPASIDTADEQPLDSTTDESEWKAVLNDTWEEVRSLVVIRHKQDGSQALLMPEQRYFLYQNLRLKLETARFALLTGQASTYQESLQSTSTWLQDYFIGAERDAMLVLVQKLHDENIQLVLPDISASLIWLQQWGNE